MGELEDALQGNSIREKIASGIPIHHSNEIARLETEYQKGVLKGAEQILDKYVSTHHELIIQYKLQKECAWHAHIDSLVALKLFIEDEKTVDPQFENNLQIEQINKEAYFRYLKTGIDQRPFANQIGIEWAKDNAAGFRDYLIFLFCFLVDKKASDYKKILEYTVTSL